MGKLVLTDDGKVVGEHELDKERVTIGRHADNDITLNDKATSGHHAVVITILSDSFLEDLDSTNGTLVNGRQVAKHPLSSGDVITIGRHQLKYEGEIADEEEFEKTMILRPSDMAAAQKAKEQPATTTQKVKVGKLKIQSGPNQGREMPLRKALTTIGKPGVQVAALTRRADGYYIVHVGATGSGGHPTVNGEDVDMHARRLASGDQIDLAGTKLEFVLVDQPD